tara:strand:- start:172 stop:723 length:552 start_codon:yes stop_codon:yes gene_type:complete
MTNLTDEEVKQWYGFYETYRRYYLFKNGNNTSAKPFKKWIETQINSNKNFKNVMGMSYDSFKNSVTTNQSGNNDIINLTNAYKEADKIMGRANSSFLEDDDVYINCKPVDTFGKEITAETNFFKSNNMSNEILDEATRNLQNGELINNVGFQTIIGVFLIIFLYYVGNYVFVKFPKKIINKDI